jgi:CubicO group peptidase (beta-lactamase class C family)
MLIIDHPVRYTVWSMKGQLVIRATVCTLCALLMVVATAVRANIGERVDAIFSDYNSRTPGCSVGVSKQGQVLIAKGYGSANLEYGIPITEDTPIYIASTSKQFTAFAVGLLAVDDRLSLSDSIRKYVPELPGYADEITIDQLIHHTDGLRDYFTLLYFAGRGYDDSLSRQEVLDVISRQRGTNFRPGTQFLYANSSYVLLPRVIESLTKVTLAEFARQRIFEPLGMKSTEYVADFRTLIPGRAEGYTKSSEGWQSPRSRFAEIGPSGVVSTASDLLRWIDALRTRALGRELTDQALSRGALNDGSDVNYGFGLSIDQYHGLEIFQHGGARPGYHSNLAYIPSLDVGVVVLCNTSDIDAQSTSNEILESIVGRRFKPQVQVDLDPDAYDGLVGTYAMSSTALLEITRQGDRLFAQASHEGRYEIFPSSSDEFFYEVADLQISFVRVEGSKATSLVLHQNGSDTTAVRVDEEVPNEMPLQEFIGAYSSQEIGSTYLIHEEDGRLRAMVGYQNIELSAVAKDTFAAPGATVEFTRDSDGRVTGFLISGQRALNVAFQRL